MGYKRLQALVLAVPLALVLGACGLGSESGDDDPSSLPIAIGLPENIQEVEGMGDDRYLGFIENVDTETVLDQLSVHSSRYNYAVDQGEIESDVDFYGITYEDNFSTWCWDSRDDEDSVELGTGGEMIYDPVTRVDLTVNEPRDDNDHVSISIERIEDTEPCPYSNQRGRD